MSGQGVREGLALSLGRETLEATDAVKRSSLEALASRFVGWSKDRARRRGGDRGGAAAGARPGMAGEVAEALRHAARILDIGRTVDFFDRHEHVADLVLATDLGGFSHRDVALLAATVRQAGDEEARPRSLAPLLTREDRGPVEQAAVLLALADEITERCAPGAAPPARCQVRGGR